MGDFSMGDWFGDYGGQSADAWNYDPMMTGMDAYQGEGFYDPSAMGYDPMLTGENAIQNGSPWYSGMSQYLPKGNTAAMLGLGGLNLLGQYYGADQQLKGSNDAFNTQLAAQQAYQNTQRSDILNAQNAALANWQQYAFPNKQAINSFTAQGMRGIGDATRNAMEQTTEGAAARGARGPALGSALAGVQKAGVESQAGLWDKVNQFANTPYSAPPITTAYPGMPSVPNYAQPISFGQRAADMLSGITGTMGGIYAYDWLKNR